MIPASKSTYSLNNPKFLRSKVKKNLTNLLKFCGFSPWRWLLSIFQLSIDPYIFLGQDENILLNRFELLLRRFYGGTRIGL
jgi:hypothetical protein